MKTKNRSRSDPETLLLVDDKPDNLIVMKKLLQRALPQVGIVTFQKPAEVMDYVRSANISAAIFDVQMPVMNGIELCQKIKSTEETRHIPVLLVTSHEASSGLKTKGLDAGADDFLTRPIDNDELVARVKVALRINRAEAQLRRMVEQLQRESGERFRDIAECAADWIWEIDANGVYTYSSAKVKSTLGYRQEEVIGKTPFDFMLPAEAERVGALFVALAKDKLTFRDLENWNLAKDGRKVCLLTSGVPILTKDGELLGYRGVDRDITARKQTETLLRKSEERFNVAVDAANIGVWEFDIPKDQLVWDRRMFQLYGIKPDEFNGAYEAWRNGLHPDDRQRALDEVTAATSGQKPFDTEFRIIRPDRSVRYIRAYANVIRAKDGTPLRMIGTNQDITELKQAEAEMIQKHLLLENLAKLVPGVIYQYRLYPDGRSAFPYSSPGMYDIYEVTPEEVREDATPVFGRLHPEDYDRVASSIQESAMTLQTFHCEFRVILPRQGLRWRSSQAKPERTADGGTLWHGIILDITESKQADEEKERLMAAINQTRETIVITDAEGLIKYVNPAFEKITGYTREETMGQNLYILKNGVHNAAFYQQMWNTLKSGETWSGLLVNVKKDGTKYTEDATISPVKDGTGKIVNYVAVKRDVTDEIKQEKKARQAQKMESVGRLAGGVAHDFNNMLQVILGYTDLVMTDTAPTDPKFNNLREIQKATERSGTLTKQLLAFAREQPIRPEILNLNDAVSDLLKMLRRLIRESIVISWHPGSNLKLVKLDPVQIDQILVNLCVNAQDAVTGAGEITIETGNVTIDESYYSGNEEALPGSYVVLTVSDNGSGMDKETLANIFEPFFTTKETGKGTGLGLATVYGIVKQNKGFINVESNVGQGTSFKIHLPQTDPSPKEVFDKPAASLPHVHGETILLVEDQTSLLTMYTLFLKHLGYNVLAAETSKKALHLFSQQPEDIQLLLTDVVMPEMNGMQLSEEIHAINPAVKVLFMSGYSADIISDQGVLDHNIAFIAKPFSMSILANKIREILETPSMPK